MPVLNLKSLSVIERLFLLRSAAIAIQLITVLAVYFIMSLDIHLMPLLAIIGVETLFHLFSIYLYKNRPASNLAILGQVVADVVFLTILLSYSGGATNAFVSLLLLPIVIGAVSLPANLSGLISVSSVIAYSGLLFVLPQQSTHHMDMTNHFIGMWINFLLSVIVVTFVVGAMARLIRDRERQIATQREKQLRNEHLLSLGVASAQVTHQLATPLANLQLLFDELIENYPNDEAVIAMEHPLIQCSSQLGYFRTLAASIRENTQQLISIKVLLDEISDTVALEFSDTQFLINYQSDEVVPLHELSIVSDAMLLPALMNLVCNGVKSNEKNGSDAIELSVVVSNEQLALSFRDFGVGLSTQQPSLGETLVRSEQGFGMAMLLSNITLERLGGSLELVGHHQQGAIAHVTLPIANVAGTA